MHTPHLATALRISSVLCLLATYATSLTPTAEAVTAVNTSGTITTIAGSSSGKAGYTGDGRAALDAQLNNPRAVALDSEGNLYIADTENNVIRVVNTLGIITTYAGGAVCSPSTVTYCGDGGLATDASLLRPIGIVFNKAGNLEIADSGNNAIREVNYATHKISTIVGTGTAGFAGDGDAATAAELNDPESIAIDASGNLFIADLGNIVVRKVAGSTGIISTYAGNHKGNGYECSEKSDQFGDNCPATDAWIRTPRWVNLDASGNLYITDPMDLSIRRVDTLGIIHLYAGDAGVGSGTCATATDNQADGCPAYDARLSYARTAIFDAAGNLYVASGQPAGGYYPELIQKIDASTGYLSFAVGNSASTPFANHGYTGDGGPANLAAIFLPTGMTFDSAGNLYFADSDNNVIRKVTLPPSTAAPKFSPLGGTYTTDLAVVISDATAGAKIYYTTDGSTPTIESAEYAGPIEITESTTVKAFAVVAGDAASAVASATYTIVPLAATPVISPSGGTYVDAQTVTIADATKSSAIYYTINGTTPTVSSTKYTVPIVVSSSETIRAIAVASGYTNSAVASATYTIDKGVTATPTISLATGTYGTEQTVTLADATAGAVIYYTINGLTPTSSSAKYTGSIAITASETLKAIAIAPDFEPSAVISATYTVAGTPTVLTASATNIAAASATLNAFVNPLGAAATYSFQYGTSKSSLTSTTKSAALAATAVPGTVSASLTGLQAKTTYYFRATVTTVGGSSTSAVLAFTTN